MKVWHILVLLLLLSACGKGSNIDFEQYTGTDGVLISFAQNAPADTVREGLPFPVRVSVHNAGAHDVDLDHLVITFSTDPLYIESNSGINPYFPKEHGDPRAPPLLGRSLGYPDGETRLYSIPTDSAFRARKVLGQREKPTTTIVASACYRYYTTASATVCIDTNVYEENVRKQVCDPAPVTFTGGQGGPIAVTKATVESLPVINPVLGGEAVRPMVTIELQDVGQGHLIGPDTLEPKTACLLKDIPREQLSAVRVQAWLLSTPLECQPSEFARFSEGVAEIRCVVPADNLADPVYSAKQNFQTTLIVNLSYLYKTSASTQVAIERTEITEDTGIPSFGKVEGYVYDGSDIRMENGAAVTYCDLYASDPSQIPADKWYKGEMDDTWSCACESTDCFKRDMQGRCVAGLCPPGGLQCCSSKTLDDIKKLQAQQEDEAENPPAPTP